MKEVVGNFWTAALGVGGLATIGAYFFYKLFKSWLQLPIFAQMTGTQTFCLMLVFLLLVFSLAVGYLRSHNATRRLPDVSTQSSSTAVFDLHRAWDGVNDVDTTPGRLIGPDVVKTSNALGITSASWRHGLVDRKLLLEDYANNYDFLVTKLASSDMIVPGFEKLGKRCKDFVSPEMLQTRDEMRAQQSKKL